MLNFGIWTSVIRCKSGKPAQEHLFLVFTTGSTTVKVVQTFFAIYFNQNFHVLGVFTAPVDGRYLFSAVLTAQTGERVEAYFSVANRNIQKLYTAGVGGGAGEGCVCGGSASISLALNLKRGQRAGLVLTSGKLAISASSEILSSFSGVLLYPTVAKR